MTRAKLQHYVPKFLLRRFSVGKKDRLHVYDKHTDKQFAGAARKLAAENALYDFELSGARLTLEPSLANLENRAAKHIERIVKGKRLHVAEPRERGELAQFLAVQMVRTRAAIELSRDMFVQIKEWARKQGMLDDFFQPPSDLGCRENADKAMFARSVARAPLDFGATLAAKDWVLLQCIEKGGYMLGDHPLTMHNMIRRPGRGNLGIGVAGIELYFPLSPRLALALWCPAHREAMVKGIQRLTDMSESQPWVAQRFAGAWTDALNIMDAITKGVPLESKRENVKFFNSLQVSSAERFVFCSDGNFALVEDMIRTNPELRHGRRMTEAAGKF